ncbi:syntaxin 6 [Coleophoma cylindrospora]|uniref:t-SNARE affecting a late Golgi compartment protein 1 n=1 Tax=Coleophoma cylindrospora TaxID=1849047 RepID=A0A3D8RC46_9HELO|nr:syntaxin 6 [Coleophoma cylindrospora]
MSSTNEQDPFLQVQADVLAQLTHTRPLFTSYLRIRSLTSSATSPELISAHHDLEVALQTLAEDLADLVDSVAAVQDDPYKYGLEIEEVSRRKRLVDEVGNEVEDMREELNRRIDQAGGNKHGKGKGRDYARNDDDAERGREDERTDYNAEFEQQQQLQMMQDQDQQLDGVFRTVGNLRQQADLMGQELEEQGEMLDNVDRLADRVGGRLQTGMQKMSYVIRKNEEKMSSCCIAVLIMVLIILLVLILIL